ncbi:MAG: GNAT family N-acetyltransferase [Chloroflexi bacterium]|nr:GNAT family N-acetyltransferase [Chloroflexota bacterium]MDA1296572.1 GNAT family N-acetyltransferase [Chloroflexota bacterium]
MEQLEPQLEMVRPGGERLSVTAVPAEYSMRQYAEPDRASYWELFSGVYGIHSRLDDLRTAALPGGFFVIEHGRYGNVVASAAAAKYSRAGHTDPGSLQWVMTDPAHTGNGLGTAVVAAATDRLSTEGYGRIYLSTDDWRLPAISIYLKLGWKPLLFLPEMEPRWRAVLIALDKQAAEADFVIEPR